MSPNSRAEHYRRVLSPAQRLSPRHLKSLCSRHQLRGPRTAEYLFCLYLLQEESGWSSLHDESPVPFELNRMLIEDVMGWARNSTEKAHDELKERAFLSTESRQQGRGRGILATFYLPGNFILPNPKEGPDATQTSLF